MSKFLLDKNNQTGKIDVSVVNEGFKRLKITGTFGEIELWSSKWEKDYEEITEEEALRRGIELANYGVYDEIQEEEQESRAFARAKEEWDRYNTRKTKG